MFSTSFQDFHFCSALPLSRCRCDLRLQSRRSGREILRPIRSRFVVFDNADCSRICPIWFCDHVSLPSSLCCEQRNKFFASPCFRDVIREMVLSSSRSSESIKHQTDLCLICDVCLRSQACSANTVYNARRPVCYTVVALYFGSDLAHLEVLRVSHAADHVLRLLAEWAERVILFQVGFQRFAIWTRFKLMNQLVRLLPCECHLVVGQLNVAILGF